MLLISYMLDFLNMKITGIDRCVYTSTNQNVTILSVHAKLPYLSPMEPQHSLGSVP